MGDFVLLRDGLVLRRDLIKTAWVEKVGRGKWAVKCDIDVIGGHMEYQGKEFRKEAEALSHLQEMFIESQEPFSLRFEDKREPGLKKWILADKNHD